MKQSIINYLTKEQKHAKKLKDYYQNQINKIKETNNNEEVFKVFVENFK